MTCMEMISRNIAKSIDQSVRELGHEPAEFYRKYNLTTKMWRVRTGKSFSKSGVQEILNLAERAAHG